MLMTVLAIPLQNSCVANAVDASRKLSNRVGKSIFHRYSVYKMATFLCVLKGCVSGRIGVGGLSAAIKAGSKCLRSVYLYVRFFFGLSTGGFAMEIRVLPLPEEKRKPKFSDESQLGFGRIFTDRMFIAEWKIGQGWVDARIEPYAPFSLDPACLVLHYAQEIFEGLKAYRWEDGSIALFRPEMNARRFNLSAERMCMPEVPEELFLQRG